jgi:hypothetical protein
MLVVACHAESCLFYNEVFASGRQPAGFTRRPRSESLSGMKGHLAALPNARSADSFYGRSCKEIDTLDHALTAPLPNVAGHVVQAIPIRWEGVCQVIFQAA